jgi:hypothetical protein
VKGYIKTAQFFLSNGTLELRDHFPCPTDVDKQAVQCMNITEHNCAVPKHYCLSSYFKERSKTTEYNNISHGGCYQSNIS